MFNPAWYFNSQGDGFAVLEFFIAGNESPNFVPLRSTRLSGSVLGPFADFTLTHNFSFSRDQCPHTIEAFYRFPLPGDAAITGVTVHFGATTITATLKPRVTAEQEYEGAKQEGKAAAMLTRESPNVFSIKVAGIAPDEDVVISTRYVQAGEPDTIGFRFRIPLTTPPRYVRGDERSTRARDVQPLAVLRDPGHRFSLEVSAPGRGMLSSPSHPLSRVGDCYHLATGDVIPDQDCILSWKPYQNKTAVSLQVFSDDTAEPYFLALVTPPVQEPECYPRELIFLVDHSGSMDGRKWAAADRTVEKLIKGLQPGDLFNLCLFESTPHWLWSQPQPVSPAGIVEALCFLADKSSGGTELGVALEQALGQGKIEGEISRQVIIITDTQVTDEARILQLIKREQTQRNPRRISILCIDSAPNTGLAGNIARYGRGIVRFLTSSTDERDINSALDDLITLWDAPSVLNLTLTVNREQVIVPDRRVLRQKEGSTTIDLGDLVPGKSVWMYGRCTQGPASCIFTIADTSQDVLAEAEGGYPSVRFLYGANIVASLEFLSNSALSQDELSGELKLLGYDLPSLKPEEKPVYHENLVKESRTQLRELIVRESLAYGIASSETAFIAVRQDAERVVQEQVIIGSALPSGWSEGFIKSSGPMMSMIMQPDGTLRMPANRKVRDFASGGSLLEWGGGVILPRNELPDNAGKHGSGGGGAHILPRQGPPEHSLITITLFRGKPVISRGESLLFDSKRRESQNIIPRGFRLKKIIFSSTSSSAEFGHIRLMLFIGDMVRQVIDIPLADLEAKGGEIEVFAVRKFGAVIRLLLIDISGEAGVSLPEMIISIEGEVT